MNSSGALDASTSHLETSGDTSSDSLDETSTIQRYESTLGKLTLKFKEQAEAFRVCVEERDRLRLQMTYKVRLIELCRSPSRVRQKVPLSHPYMSVLAWSLLCGLDVEFHKTPAERVAAANATCVRNVCRQINVKSPDEVDTALTKILKAFRSLAHVRVLLDRIYQTVAPSKPEMLLETIALWKEHFFSEASAGPRPVFSAAST